jgi:alkylhydroperoxidase/carboxymuconolactone decarboxylase family protein YurZ
MSDNQAISPAFRTFLTETPSHAQAWMTAIESLGVASALDQKTQCLAYLAVLAALRLESGVPFHVAHARSVGASRAEVLSAILVGLPAAGHVVTQVLPAAVDAYDRAERDAASG